MRRGSGTALGAPVNLGWRCFEGSHATGLPGGIYPHPYPKGDVKSIWAWNHTFASCVIGGFAYRGAAIPDLRGESFFADFSVNKIFTFTTPVSGIVSSAQERTARFAPGGGLSIATPASFGQDASGELYILDFVGGEALKIVPTWPSARGASAYGSGTPGCHWPQVLEAGTTPLVDHPGFLVCAS